MRTGDKSNVIETRLKKEAENLRREKDILNEDIDVSIEIMLYNYLPLYKVTGLNRDRDLEEGERHPQ